MHKEQRVRDMASAVLTRQAEARVERTGESFEEALKAVLETEAGQQLRELRDGPHRDKEGRRELFADYFKNVLEAISLLMASKNASDTIHPGMRIRNLLTTP
jgi:hypothetical protein